MSFSSDEVNYLIYRYLKESGFQHTAFTFGYESNIIRADVNPTEVSHGALINIVQKGLLYLDIEREVKGIPKEGSEPTVLVRSLNNALTHSGAVTTTNSNTGAAPTRSKKDAASSTSTSSKSTAATPAKSTSLSYPSRQPTSSSYSQSTTSHDSSYKAPSSASHAPSSHSSSHAMVPPISIPRPSSPAMDVDIMGLSPSRQSPDDMPQLPPSPGASSTASSAPAPIAASSSHHATHKTSKTKEDGSSSISTKASSSGPASASATKVEKPVAHKSEKSARPAASSTTVAPASSATNAPAAVSTVSASSSASAPGSSPKPSRLLLKGHVAEVVACGWNPRNHELLATCSSDSTVRLWTLQQGLARASSAALHHGPKVKPGMTPPSQVMTVQWSPSGSSLATACFDGSVRLWDAGVGVPKTQLNTKLNAHTGAVFALRWNPAGSLLASVGADRSLCLWNPASPAIGNSSSTAVLSHKFDKLHDDGILDVDFGSDNWIATASVDKTLKVLRYPSSSTVTTSASDPYTGPTFTAAGHSLSVNSVRWSPLVPGLLASGSDDTSLRLWKLPGDSLSTHGEASGNTSTQLETFKALSGHSKEVYQLRWHPTVAQIASASFDSTVKLWDPEAASIINTLSTHTEAVLSLDYAPSGHLLASGSQDKTVCVWDSRTSSAAKQFTCSGCVLDVSINPAEDRVAACCSDNSAVVFDLRM